RGPDDRPTPPHRDEMNRKTAPGRDSAAPSSPAPVANRITATESPTKKACNGLLQQNLPQTDSCTAAKMPVALGHSITSSASNWNSRLVASPRAWAIFRLMTSSNLIGCSIVAGGVTSRLWKMGDIVDLLEAWERLRTSRAA